MRIHHLSCGTFCPFGKRLMQGEGGWLEPSDAPCHCLLLETDHGLVLVDTGFGTRDVQDPTRFALSMRLLMRPDLRPEKTAVHQLRALGFSPADVRHIVVTHLDYDHAGGLSDFPEARVHIFRTELEAANRRDVRMGHARYRPVQWAYGPTWEQYDTTGEPWHGFPCVRGLRGLPPEILMIPLFGHTPGHCGIAIQTDGERWLLHAGDAYFFHDEMDLRSPRMPPGLAAYEMLMESDRGKRLANQDRLRELLKNHGDTVSVFCAHDASELRAMQRLSTARPEAPPPEERPRPQPSA